MSAKMVSLSALPSLSVSSRMRSLSEGLEFDFVAWCGGKGGDGFLAVEVFGGAVFIAGVIVGFDFGERFGSGIGCGEVEGFTLDRGPDRLVAYGAHLLELLELGRVVHGAEGLVAAAINVDSVGDFVVFLPHPVFFVDGGENIGAGGVGRAASEQVLDQKFGKVFVAGLIEEDSVTSELFLHLEPGMESGVAVHEWDVFLLCHLLHGGGVEG